MITHTFMNKYSSLIASILIVSSLVFGACSTSQPANELMEAPITIQEAERSQPEESQQIPFTAQFEIYTLGTKRVFTNKMYHDLSEIVFITGDAPNTVVVQESNITWQDFFDTLPFSLTEDCLVTGTNQTFCTNETNSLNFYINGEITPTALDLRIQPEDVLVVRYQ